MQFFHELCAPQNSELLWQSQNTKYKQLQLGYYYKLHSFPHYCRLEQQVNFKSGTNNGRKHTPSCIHSVLIADHKTNKRNQQLGVASKGTWFIPHSTKSVLQLPSSRTQQNTVTIYLICIPFMHTVQIANKYHIWEWVHYGSGSSHCPELVYNSDSLGNKSTTTFSYHHTRWYMETLNI